MALSSTEATSNVPRSTGGVSSRGRSGDEALNSLLACGRQLDALRGVP